MRRSETSSPRAAHTIKLFKNPSYAGAGAPSSEVLPQCPLRGVLLGPSATGKTTLLVSLLLHQYRGAFKRLYIFSPSLDIDRAWQPVKDYSEQVLKVNQAREKTFFSDWNPGALAKILETQTKIAEHCKERYTTVDQIIVVIDDFLDRPDVMRDGGNIVSTLFIRGRHSFCNVLISSQKLRSGVGTVCRVNSCFWIVFRLRNRKELDAIVEELSAVYPAQILYKMYEVATAEPYSFWFVDLMRKNREDMFWLRFDKRLRVVDCTNGQQSRAGHSSGSQPPPPKAAPSGSDVVLGARSLRSGSPPDLQAPPRAPAPAPPAR